MRPRRSAATLAVTAVVALATAAHGAKGATLDGQRKREHTYPGTLSETVLSGDAGQGAVVGKVLSPSPSDCIPDACDDTTLVLTVPKGRQSGRFDYRVDFYDPNTGQPSYTSAVHVAIYDAEGGLVARSGQLLFDYWRYTRARLAPGAYRVVIYNQGGPVDFEATATWSVNPRHPAG